ncbi:NHL repeat-containing protein, partial [mine drainage metagenome]
TIGLVGTGNGPELAQFPAGLAVVAGTVSGTPVPTPPPSVSPMPAASALFYAGGFAMDGAGNLYIADPNNDLAYKVTGLSTASPQIVLVAGNYSGTPPSATPEPATSATTCPNGIAVDGAGNLYIADDCNNSLIEKVDASTGEIVVIAGTPSGGGTVPTTTPEPAASAKLMVPQGVV